VTRPRQHGYTQRDLAKRLGRSQSHIAKRLSLLNLPEGVRAEMDSGGITLPGALELAKLAKTPDRLKTALRRARSTAGSRRRFVVRSRSRSRTKGRRGRRRLRRSAIRPRMLERAGRRSERTGSKRPHSRAMPSTRSRSTTLMASCSMHWRRHAQPGASETRRRRRPGQVSRGWRRKPTRSRARPPRRSVQFPSDALTGGRPPQPDRS
jgi:transcriptional regulator with XRE-family HTH domain